MLPSGARLGEVLMPEKSRRQVEPSALGRREGAK
jgi:hypothetical protein